METLHLDAQRELRARREQPRLKLTTAHSDGIQYLRRFGDLVSPIFPSFCHLLCERYGAWLCTVEVREFPNEIELPKSGMVHTHINGKVLVLLPATYAGYRVM